MVTRKDYNKLTVEAAKSVLLELVHLLGEYRDHIVLVGGWVPEFIVSSADNPHVGSIDVDIAIDHREILGDAYRTIQELLLSRGYRQGNQPYIFFRELTIDGQQVKVEIDLLSGEYEGTGKSHRHQKIQGVLARKARGCDLAFEAPVKVTVEGTLPGGGQDSVQVQVASIVSFLAMKGMAIEDRLKEKDAWDIYYCLKYFPGGVEALVEKFLPYAGSVLVKEGLEKIGKIFTSEDHVGPKFVADFEEISDPEERQRIQRDAFERVDFLLRKLGIR